MESQQPSEDLPRCDQSNQTAPTAQLQPTRSEPAQPGESKTREYLSNERTYLSWMRTAVSLMGIGVILGRIPVAWLPLAPSLESTWQLSIIFASVGLIAVFLATQHYLAVRREIENDSNEITERWVIVFSIVAILIGSGIVYYVLIYTLGHTVSSTNGSIINESILRVSV